MKNIPTEDIDLYLMGKLPEDRKQALEQRLESDDEFAKAFKEHQDVYRATKYHWERENLKHKLDRMGRRKLRTRKVTQLYLPIAVAASLLLFVTLNYVIPLFQNSNNVPAAVTTPIAALDDFVRALPPPSFSSLGQIEEDWVQTVKLFQKGKYEQAADGFSLLLNSKDFNPELVNEARLFLSFSQIKLNKPRLALQQLDQIPTEATTLHKEAVWLKALALLQIDKGDENARAILRDIAGNLTYKQNRREEAKRLLKIVANSPIY